MLFREQVRPPDSDGALTSQYTKDQLWELSKRVKRGEDRVQLKRRLVELLWNGRFVAVSPSYMKPQLKSKATSSDMHTRPQLQDQDREPPPSPQPDHHVHQPFPPSRPLSLTLLYTDTSL